MQIYCLVSISTGVYRLVRVYGFIGEGTLVFPSTSIYAAARKGLRLFFRMKSGYETFLALKRPPGFFPCGLFCFHRNRRQTVEHNFYEAWAMGRERQKDLLAEGHRRRRASSVVSPSGRSGLRMRVGAMLIALGLKLSGIDEESGASDQ